MRQRYQEDWTIVSSEERAPTFDTLFVNADGERWWARITPDFRVVVWGIAVIPEVATSSPGARVSTKPWIMDGAESMWLEAVLIVARERAAMVARLGMPIRADDGQIIVPGDAS